MRSAVAVAAASVMFSAPDCGIWEMASSRAETNGKTVAGRTIAGWSADLPSQNAVVRLRAVRSLGSFGSPAVPALTDALRDSDAGVRAAAAGALGEIGPPAAAARNEP